MQWSDLDALIFRHWSDLDGAMCRANQIEDRVLEELGEVVGRWCAERSWVGTFDPNDNLWFAPPSWALEGGKRPSADAWFEWGYGFGDDDDCDHGDDWFALTRLIGEGRNVSGFRLHQTRRRKKEWAIELRDISSDTGLSSFTLDDNPSLFLPFILNKEEVIAALQDGDFTEVLAPVLIALGHVEKAVAVVEPLLGLRKN